MDLNDLNKVWEIKPLKKIGEEDAREVLEKVAKQVQPIMRKRKWKVNILSEFWYAGFSLSPHTLFLYYTRARARAYICYLCKIAF